MNTWTAIVAIVFIVSLANIRMAKYKALGNHPRFGSRGSETAELASPRKAELERDLVDLKKRLAVLERIATDERQSKSIADEIEALRDR